MSQYTKGPWINDGEVSGREGKAILVICGEREDSTVLKIVGPQREGVANLVIAAPELLEAAKEYQKCVQERLNAQHAFRSEDSSENSRWFAISIDSLRTAEVDLLAAIAKAEGL